MCWGLQRASSLERCPIFRVSLIERFNCITPLLYNTYLCVVLFYGAVIYGVHSLLNLQQLQCTCVEVGWVSSIHPSLVCLFVGAECVGRRGTV